MDKFGIELDQDRCEFGTILLQNGTSKFSLDGRDIEERVLYSKISGAIDDVSVKKYIKAHNSYVSNVEQRPSSKERHFSMIYDASAIKTLVTITPLQLKAFCDMHRGWIEAYKSCLTSTIIYVSSDIVRDFINGVLSVLYVPVRPIKFVTDFDDPDLGQFLEESRRSRYLSDSSDQ